MLLPPGVWTVVLGKEVYIGLQSQGYGIDWRSGGTLYMSDSAVQGQVQFAYGGGKCARIRHHRDGQYLHAVSETQVARLMLGYARPETTRVRLCQYNCSRLFATSKQLPPDPSERCIAILANSHWVKTLRARVASDPWTSWSEDETFTECTLSLSPRRWGTTRRRSIGIGRKLKI